MRDERDDGSAIFGVVVGLAILVVAAAAVFVGTHLAEWL